MAAYNVISKGKIEYFLTREPRDKLQPSLNHVFKTDCLINVVQDKSDLCTS